MRKSSSRSSLRGWFRVRRGFLIAFVLALCAALAAFSYYLVQLDHVVRTRFAGARWALPAQVYAAPLELYPGLRVDAAMLQRELGRLGYRHVSDAAGPGTFSVSGSTIDLVTRAFRFWDGAQPSSRLSVRFSGHSISEILEPGAPSPRVIARLDPLPIGSIHPAHGEDRVLVKIADVPELLPKGLVLVEDQHFYQHHGISIRGISRAALANLRAGRVVQGGSTITQQLVRNFFLTLDQTWARKANEALMSLLLEAHYSKDQILEAYLNEIFLGQDGDRAIHGFGLASRFYFNKPLSELQSHEIALLIGLAKGASYYNPRRNPERAKARRALVLRLFREAGYIDEAEYQAGLERPLGVTGVKGGVERFPAFIELVKRQLRRDYQDEDLLSEGLRIFTTLDPRAQESLETRMTEGLDRIELSRKMVEDSLQGAGVVVSLEGGEVQALVGGRDSHYAGFNRALDARRPIGSLAKPFVYLAALSEPGRYNLLTPVDEQPVSLKLPNGSTWTPQNYDHELHGVFPLYLGLAKSYNLATVKVGLDVGVDRVAKMFEAAGYPGTMTPLPSIMLGAAEIPAIDVAQMYATIGNGGYQYPLTAIRDVTTVDGEPLNRYPLRGKTALPDAPVFLLNWAMEQVMIFGTGASAYNVISPATRLAGKSGTTDDYRDAWFAGYGGDRATVIWVGRDDNKSTGLSGSSGALPIWSQVMSDLRVSSFDPLPPSKVETVLVEPQSGLRADEGCMNPIAVPFVADYSPEDYAPCANAYRPGALQWFRDIFR